MTPEMVEHWRAGMMLVGAQTLVIVFGLIAAAVEIIRRERAAKLDIKIIEDYKRLESGK